MSKLSTKTIVKRVWCVQALARSGRCEFDDFYQSLEREEQKKLINLIEMVADKGIVTNSQKLKKLPGTQDIWELKPTNQVRIFCWLHSVNRAFTLAFGVKKKRRRHLKSDIQKAERLRGEYFRQLATGPEKKDQETQKDE